MKTEQSLSWKETRQLLNEDVAAYARFSADFIGHDLRWTRRLGILLTPSLLCSAAYRVSHLLWCKGWQRLAWGVARANYLLHKCWIPPYAVIRGGLYIPHTVGVFFEGHAGRNFTLYTNVYVTSSVGDGSRRVPEAIPVFGDDVTVGAYAVVQGRVRIGSGVKIGPASIVCESVPENAYVVSGQISRPVIRAATHPQQAEKKNSHGELHAA